MVFFENYGKSYGFLVRIRPWLLRDFCIFETKLEIKRTTFKKKFIKKDFFIEEIWHFENQSMGNFWIGNFEKFLAKIPIEIQLFSIFGKIENRKKLNFNWNFQKIFGKNRKILIFSKISKIHPYPCSRKASRTDLFI